MSWVPVLLVFLPLSTLHFVVKTVPRTIQGGCLDCMHDCRSLALGRSNGLLVDQVSQSNGLSISRMDCRSILYTIVGLARTCPNEPPKGYRAPLVVHTCRLLTDSEWMISSQCYESFVLPHETES